MPLRSRQILRRCAPQDKVLTQRKRIHQPRQRDSAEEERTEDEEEKADPFRARFLPEQREESPRRHGVDEHQHDVIAEKAHSFRPCAMSKTSSTRSRFMSPAVMVKAVPCSKVMEVTSPCTPIDVAIQ